MRRWIGIGLVAAGVAVLCIPFTHAVTFSGTDHPLRGTAKCVPVRDAFKNPPNQGWFGYAPGSQEIYLGSDVCGPTARRRLVIGALPIGLGAGLLLWERRRRGPAPRTA